MRLQRRVCSMEANQRGRDYFVGDLHGQFDQLQDLLDAVAFGPSDRLFSVGDLVDRGPRSWDVLEWFAATPNAYAVLGNHDALLLASLEGDGRVEAARKWGFMGNEWFAPIEGHQRALAHDLVSAFPLGMTIALQDGRSVGLIHASLQLAATWPAFQAYPEDRIDACDMRGVDPNSAALWGRTHALATIHASWASNLPVELTTRYSVYAGLQSAAGVDLLLAGHTPMPNRVPLLGGNRMFIDTGSYLEDGYLTMVEPISRRVFQAPNESKGGWGKEIDWPLAISSEPFRLSEVEIAQVREIFAEKRSRPRSTDSRSYDDLA